MRRSRKALGGKGAERISTRKRGEKIWKGSQPGKGGKELREEKTLGGKSLRGERGERVSTAKGGKRS